MSATSNGEKLFEKNSSHRKGLDYEIRVPTYILMCLHNQGLRFEMATEMSENEKFDDLFVQIFNPNPITYLMQLKHKNDVSKKIRYQDLISSKNKDYDLAKYFNSFLKIKRRGLYEKIWKDVKFVICTTLDFDVDDCESKNIEVLESYEGNEIFCLGHSKLGNVYQLKIEQESVKEEIYNHFFSKFDLSKSEFLSLYTEMELSSEFQDVVMANESERCSTINDRSKKNQRRWRKDYDLHKELFSSLIDCFLEKLFFVVTEKEEKIKRLIRKRIVKVYGSKRSKIIISLVSGYIENWMEYDRVGQGCYLTNNPYQKAVDFIEKWECRIHNDYTQSKQYCHVEKLKLSVNIESNDLWRAREIWDGVLQKLAKYHNFHWPMLFLANYSHDTIGAYVGFLPNLAVHYSNDIYFDFKIEKFSEDKNEDIQRFFEMAQVLILALSINLLYNNRGWPFREGDEIKRNQFESLSVCNGFCQPMMYSDLLPFYLRNVERLDDEKFREYERSFPLVDVYEYFNENILPDIARYLNSRRVDFFRRS